VNGYVKYRGRHPRSATRPKRVRVARVHGSPKPGTVIGFGTIPDCTGLDHDDFIDPGAEIQVTFERLGRSAAGSPSRRASCCRAAGRSGRRCRNTRMSPMTENYEKNIHRYCRRLLAALFAAALRAGAAGEETNIVIILGDDLGFADMGRSAARSRREPRRAGKRGRPLRQFLHARDLLAHAIILLTGVDTHVNGLGNMDEWRRPTSGAWTATKAISTTGWSRCRSCSRNRYHTYMSASGTWASRRNRSRPRAGSSATSRCSKGRAATGHDDFTAASRVGLYRGRRYLTGLPKDYYARRPIRQADRIHRRQPRRRQALLRLCRPPGAARPLPPAAEWRSRHVGEYDKVGRVRQERLKRQIELGIMPAERSSPSGCVHSDPIVLAPATRAILGKKMELYAGMVENWTSTSAPDDHLKKSASTRTRSSLCSRQRRRGTDLFR